MSNKTILQSNNDVLSANNLELQNLIDLANNLPEAGPSAPESTPLILNKVDSIGDFNHDPKISQTIKHTIQLNLDAIKDIIIYISDTEAQYYQGNSYFTLLEPLQSTTFGHWTLGNANLSGSSNVDNYIPGYITLTPSEGTQLRKDLILTLQTNAKSSGRYYDVEKFIYIIAIGKQGEIDINKIKVPFVYWTCYLKDTLITLSNNHTKKVQDITYQDDLLVWDFDNGCFTSAKPLWIKKSEIATQYYHCVFENGIILDLVGSNGNCHAIFNLDDNKFEYANNCVGKTVMTQNGPTKLLSCDIVEDTVEFYNIITDYHMNCYANNILTSTTLNNIYPIKDMKFIKENREIISQNKFHPITQQYYNGLRLGEQNKLSLQEIDRKISILHKIKLEKT